MKSEHYQPKPETLRRLRFTAHDPLLDEGLVNLENTVHSHAEDFTRHLFLYSMKALRLDDSDRYDGRSLNISQYEQYRHNIVQNVSKRGKRRFKVASFVHPIRSEGEVVGVGLRVEPDQFAAHQLIAPPFYTGGERSAGYIPVFYRIERPAEELEAPLDRLERVLSLGTWVSELTIVPLAPKAARTRDVFMNPPVQRTGGYIRTALENEPPLPPVIDMVTEKTRLHPKGNGTGPEAA